MTLLELDRVAHSYGEHAVVRELSLTLAEGEIGCLLGASGCGKTTALRLIAGFEQPDAGEVRIDGATVGSRERMTPPEQRRIGMVFQEYALFPHLSINDNIGFGLRKSGMAARRQRVDELLRLVDLAGLESMFPHELSGGQQQRVALARALAPSPRLLLLDEPFSNLDVELRERLSLEVRDILKTTGTTAILVTHDQHEAFAVADAVGLMRDGRIEQWASPYDLYHRPTTRYVADFVGQGVFLPAVVADADAVDMELGRLTCKLPADCGLDCPIQVLLRPDDIVHDDASPLRAEVTAKAFRGAEFLYTLRLPSGERLLSLVPSHHNHAVGEHIGIRLDVDHVVAFRNDPLATG